jgi:hypothetical protein
MAGNGQPESLSHHWPGRHQQNYVSVLPVSFSRLLLQIIRYYLSPAEKIINHGRHRLRPCSTGRPAVIKNFDRPVKRSSQEALPVNPYPTDISARW